MSDFYRVLGVHKQANAAEIKTAYRKLAQKWHPDRHPEKDKSTAERRFQEIQSAYDVLSNDSTRKEYDLFGSESTTRSGRQYTGNDDVWMYEARHRADFEDVFREFSDDVIIPCAVSFVDAELGGSLTSTYRGKPLIVKLPPGTRQGAILSTNVLFVKAKVVLTAPEHITIQKSDLTVKTPLPFAHALAGCTYEFKHWLGSTLSVQWPSGTHTGKKLRLKGHGLTGIYGRGDLYLEAVVSIDPPAALVEEAKKMIQKNATISPHISWA